MGMIFGTWNVRSLYRSGSLDLGEVGLGGGGLEWIQQSQDRDPWGAVVSVVMNLQVPAPQSELVYI
jgi:hypothetical protein